jgi:nitrogen regulatory protein P-II 1
MKRIDAMIPNMKRSQVVDAIITAGAGGLTVSETRGKGASPRPLVGGARGTAKYVAEYNRTDTITTIVEDSQVDAIVKAIIGVVQTGSKSDGKIFVSNVEETYDISTGKKGKL